MIVNFEVIFWEGTERRESGVGGMSIDILHLLKYIEWYVTGFLSKCLFKVVKVVLNYS